MGEFREWIKRWLPIEAANTGYRLQYRLGCQKCHWWGRALKKGKARWQLSQGHGQGEKGKYLWEIQLHTPLLSSSTRGTKLSFFLFFLFFIGTIYLTFKTSWWAVCCYPHFTNEEINPPGEVKGVWSNMNTSLKLGPLMSLDGGST